MASGGTRNSASAMTSVTDLSQKQLEEPVVYIWDLQIILCQKQQTMGDGGLKCPRVPLKTPRICLVGHQILFESVEAVHQLLLVLHARQIAYEIDFIFVYFP